MSTDAEADAGSQVGHEPEPCFETPVEPSSETSVESPTATDADFGAPCLGPDTGPDGCAEFAVDLPGKPADASDARWLSAEELQVWRAFTLLIARLPSALESQLQRDSGLSFVEYYVLAGLSDAPRRTMRMSQLAMFTYAELSRLSHVMTRLERRGLVRREPDPTDGRYTNAILTDEGYALLVKAAPCHVASARELVVDALDQDQLQQLGGISERIVARIDARLQQRTGIKGPGC